MTEATGLDRPAPLDPAATSAKPHDRPAPPFAHASEAELARILDFYAVRWEYEPHTFPILWNLDGGVVESFAPDFYLPDLDVYLELTTLKQRLVRKKNRKLRRLRELYPDLRVKLFYARDFRALMLKYGKVALVDGLSGTLGQVISAKEARAVAEALATATVPDTIDEARVPSPAPLVVDSVIEAAVSAPREVPAIRRSRAARRRRAAAARRAALRADGAAGTLATAAPATETAADPGGEAA